MGGGGPGGFPGGMPFFMGGGGMPHGHSHRHGHGHGGDDSDDEVDTEGLYEVLGLDKESASASDIKKAYFVIARKEHPDRGGDPEKFKAAQHAYEILSDPEKKELYDEHGEKGVERGGGPPDESDLLRAMFGGGPVRRAPRGPRKGDPSVKPLHVSLADLYSGKTVKIAVTRTKFVEDPDGTVMNRMTGERYTRTPERQVIEAHVEKGMKHGQKLTFDSLGDVVPGQLAGDLILVVQQEKHDLFVRKGSDLIFKKEITLGEALTGVDFTIDHLDGHKVHIKSPEGMVIKHESVMQVQEQGMPIYSHTHIKGCLLVQFDVQWPDDLTLTKAQRAALLGILGVSDAEDAGSGGAAGTGGDGKEEDAPEVDHCELEPLDMDARRQREAMATSAYDSDDEDGGGMGGQRVQCASQ